MHRQKRVKGKCLRRFVILSGEEKKGVPRVVAVGLVGMAVAVVMVGVMTVIMRWYKATMNHFGKWYCKHYNPTFD